MDISNITYLLRYCIMFKSIVIIILLIVLLQVKNLAGPPFDTDDPEPVDYLHWEFYISSIMEFQHNESNLTLPHIEINYGVIPNLQIHVLAPMEYLHSAIGTKYGYSSTELGIKYRFVNESENLPQIGLFPLVEIPTGNMNEDLSNGGYRFYLPFWFQKSLGKFTSYCGAGYWFNPGQGNRNWLFTGWEVQYDFSEIITLGGEVYYHTPDIQGSKPTAGFNLGGFINPDESNHILFSIGSTSGSGRTITGYLGYQMTI
jgi:hypothetical protein